MSKILFVRAESLLLERGIHNLRDNVVLWSEETKIEDLVAIELVIFDAREADGQLSHFVNHFSWFVQNVSSHIWVLCQAKHRPMFLQTSFTHRCRIQDVDEQKAAEKIFVDKNHFVVRV